MKLVVMLSVLIGLVGCVPPSNINMAKGKYLCRDSGGLYEFRAINEQVVMCRNGKTFSVTELERTVIDDPNYFAKRRN